MSRGFLFLAIVSALLGVLVTVAWIHSYGHLDNFDLNATTWSVGTSSSFGHVRFDFATWDNGRGNEPGIHFDSGRHNDDFLPISPNHPAVVWHAGSSLIYDHAANRLGGHWWGLTVPVWPIVILTAVAPTVWLRRRRRHPAGHCPTCGYDLRATPDRCPECGHAPAGVTS